MKYNNKGCCEGCGQVTWIRNDKMQGLVCKNCDEPTMRFKPKMSYDRHRSYDREDYVEFLPRQKKAV